MSVTRTVFASPVFWLLGASFLAGRAMGNVDAIVWLFVSPWPVAAAVTYAIERWYIGPRRRTRVNWIDGQSVGRCAHGHPYYCGHCGRVPR